MINKIKLEWSTKMSNKNWDDKKDFTQLNDKECVYVLNEEVARLRQKDFEQQRMYNDQTWNYFAKKS